MNYDDLLAAATVAALPAAALEQSPNGPAAVAEAAKAQGEAVCTALGVKPAAKGKAKAAKPPPTVKL